VLGKRFELPFLGFTIMETYKVSKDDWLSRWTIVNCWLCECSHCNEWGSGGRISWDQNYRSWG
jgi:hypothetical protein